MGNFTCLTTPVQFLSVDWRCVILVSVIGQYFSLNTHYITFWGWFTILKPRCFYTCVHGHYTHSSPSHPIALIYGYGKFNLMPRLYSGVRCTVLYAICMCSHIIHKSFLKGTYANANTPLSLVVFAWSTAYFTFQLWGDFWLVSSWVPAQGVSPCVHLCLQARWTLFMDVQCMDMWQPLYALHKCNLCFSSI